MEYIRLGGYIGAFGFIGDWGSFPKIVILWRVVPTLCSAYNEFVSEKESCTLSEVSMIIGIR